MILPYHHLHSDILSLRLLHWLFGNQGPNHSGQENVSINRTHGVNCMCKFLKLCNESEISVDLALKPFWRRNEKHLKQSEATQAMSLFRLLYNVQLFSWCTMKTMVSIWWQQDESIEKLMWKCWYLGDMQVKKSYNDQINSDRKWVKN